MNVFINSHKLIEILILGYPILLIFYSLSQHIIISYSVPDNVLGDEDRVMNKIWFLFRKNSDSWGRDEHIFVCVQ